MLDDYRKGRTDWQTYETDFLDLMERLRSTVARCVLSSKQPRIRSSK